MFYNYFSELQHIPFGRITNFSTRKGKAVFLNDILDEAKERTLEGMKNSISTLLNITLSQKCNHNHVFECCIKIFNLFLCSCFNGGLCQFKIKVTFFFFQCLV